MKKSFIVLSAVLLLVFSQHAWAQSEFPQEILDLFEEHYGTDDFEGLYFYDMPDGSALCVMYGETGYMDIDRSNDSRRENWVTEEQISPVDGTWQILFIRHDTITPRADGTFYPDELGFDLVCENTGRQISYHYNGTDFVICGWKNPSAYNGEVIMRGLTAMYYPAGSTLPEAICSLSEYSSSIFKRFDDLPFTPVHGQKLVSMTESAVANYFPGYTLRSYNGGEASYSRIENGMLYVKRATFTVEREHPYVLDCMPVPLSEALLQKLEKAPFDQLLWINGNNDLFQTEAAFDTNQIPVTGRIRHSDVQRDALLLLMEDEQGVCRLYVIAATEDGYHVETTPALPSGTGLDLVHSGDGEIYLDWAEEISGTVRYRSAGFTRRSDGRWALQWVMNGATDANDYTVRYCGVCYEYTPGRTDGLIIGSLPNSFLPECDLSALPTSMEQVIAAVDCSGWAKVNNPDPEDRLHLCTEPNKNAPSLGKFYNGTPVWVINEQNGWCQVEIGTDGRLVGWMMKKYLAFGDQMNTVQCAFPQKVLRNEYEDRSLYTSMDMDEKITIEGSLWVAGVAEGDLYVILTTVGQTAYAPMDWFWEGNG